MSVPYVMLVLLVIGVVLWLINRYVPMANILKQSLNIVVVIVVIVWLLNAFGVFAATLAGFDART